MNRPDWKLPAGVPRALWHYTQSDEIADAYDEFFEHTELLGFDRQVVSDVLLNELGSESIVADLGCGSGRMVTMLADRGSHVLAIDLSHGMLDTVCQKTEDISDRVIPICSNLVSLDGIATGSVDHAICMFATLGMIHGRSNRSAAVDHIVRILKPSGKLILHVHNYWYSLRDRKGVRWVLGNILKGVFQKHAEIGDRVFTYRGIPNMFHHAFQWRELKGLLRRAGFKISRRICLSRSRADKLQWPWLLPTVRANGWIVVCTKQ